MAMLPKVVEAIKDKEQEMEFSTHPLKELRFDDAWLTVDGEQYFVTETARRMLADGLRMPAAFVLFYERVLYIGRTPKPTPQGEVMNYGSAGEETWQ